VGRDRPSDPLAVAPPALSLEEAEDVARRVFGIVASASPLEAERDQNLKLTSSDGAFLLKISNPADPGGALEMQNLAMLHIVACAPELPVMRPLSALDGALVTRLELRDGRRSFVRLFPFLPGAPRPPSELDDETLFRFGATVARMGVALRGFFHRSAGYEILWDVKHTGHLRGLVPSIRDAGRRAAVERVLVRFDEGVDGVLPILRSQVIHNDLTLDNVLLDDSLRVSGIIDFGDLTHSILVGDLAIALVSLMWGRDDPLDAAYQAVRGYVSVTELEDIETRILGDLIGARLAALVTIAEWRVERYPENAAYITANQAMAWDLLERQDGAGANELEGVLRDAAAGRTRRQRPTQGELLDRRRDALGPALSPLSYDEPLYLVRGEGARMFDVHGVAYLDAYNNVPVVGHSNPRVAAAIAEQSATLNTNTRYLHESVVELAERLVSTMPPGLDTVMFYNSGSEANDIAWRLATVFTGADGALVTERAYHGVTTATIALSPEEWVDPNGPSNVVTVPAPDTYRASPTADDYATAVRSALERLSARNHGAAAFFFDSLFTSDGIYTPPPDVLRGAVAVARAAGVLIVADEVQCGYGRSGSHMWSFERFGIVPDLVTLGKPMGNGHPIAAVITRREIAQRFADDIDMFSTFGGNPVAARAGLAVLDEIQRNGLIERAGDVGSHLRQGLDELEDGHREIGDVRGAGLMIGVEIVRDRASRAPDGRRAQALINEMRRRRILVGTTGPHDNVLKIRPPLILGKDDAETIVAALAASLST
jgi:4-aminobutyrate aminotransferase-like enzyme/Ser/Thr protein kinase RdoA (MazF antagonist)